VWIDRFISLQQSKYKKFACDREGKDSNSACNAKKKKQREQIEAKQVEKQKREQQKDSNRICNDIARITTGSTAGTLTSYRSTLRPTSTIHFSTRNSTSHRRHRQPKRSESNKLSKIAVLNVLFITGRIIDAQDHRNRQANHSSLRMAVDSGARVFASQSQLLNDTIL
jgi:hypothetical protein